LEFEQADFSRFPCLAMAYESLKIGGTATTILNAANEIAVDAFLNEKLGFTKIAKVIEKTLEAIPSREACNLDIILDVDQQARATATDYVLQMGLQ